jgi:hypothetical protein
MSSFSLKDNQLEEIAEHFLNAVLKSHPAAQRLVQNNQDKRNELRAMLFNTMKQLRDQRSEALTPNGLIHPQYSKHLMSALSLALNLNLKLDKNLEQALAAQLHKNPKLLLQLEKALSQAGLLDPQMQEMIKELKDLQMNKSPTLKPGGSKSKNDSDKEKEEKKEQESDPYIALLGLITSKQSGGMAAIVQCFLGNLLGIVDQNPNINNDARDPQIARNREVVTPYDDLGITEQIRENYESIPGTLESLLDIMSPDAHRWMHEQLHAIHNRPHLSQH